MYGSLFRFKDHAYVTAREDQRGPDMFTPNRRTVYLPVIRSALYEVLQAFDFPDPSVTVGNRASTTVATQALVMMNSDLVATYARYLADATLSAEEDDDRRRIGYVFRRTLSRPPTEQETTHALDFVAQAERSWSAHDGTDPTRFAWRSLCRVLIGSNEFIYVE